ncbi:NTE family protein [Scopulibacillus darangshiensis]|uniref:NTE family protein n=2 Tax=Scopulibacillus darangshiensis TaxID=442528 RepID=A0A4R2P6L3_9BACL|nr:NTE family protein [Scopulibacillus darangshiensis]
MKPTIGIALGSGGAKGFAHAGVLRVLEAEGIAIDYLAGSSIGALVCALYSVGHRYDSMYKMAMTFKREHYLDFIFPRMGFVSGKKVTSLIKAITHNKTFKDCQTPLKIVATDLLAGERVVFDEGYLYEAVRASISIPGIFTPVKKNGRLLVDGGVIDRVPVTVVKDMGADIVIGVDVARFKRQPEISSIYDVIMQSIDIMQEEMVKSQELNADVVIRPNVGQFHSKAFTSIDEIIKIGEDTAREQLPEILNAIKNWKEQSI